MPAFIDTAFLESNKHLSEKDYGSLTRRFIKAINPVITTSIRKKLSFEAIPFKTYVEDYVLYQPTYDLAPDIAMDMVIIPIFFHTKFSASFFPKFDDEYYAYVDHMTSVGSPPGLEGPLSKYEEINGLKALDASVYHSLTYASYEIDKHVKAMFKKCPMSREVSDEMEVCPSFFVPFERDSEFPITLALHVNLIL